MPKPVACANCGAEIVGEAPAARTPCLHCGSLARGYGEWLDGGVYTWTGADLPVRVIPYPEALLATAQSLIDAGHFSIAVVVAHMACEISTERGLSRAFAAKGIAYLEDAMDEFLPGYSLANSRLLKLYNAVTGDQIQDQPFWAEFKAHATRRNDAVHGAKIVTKAEAEASLKAATDFVAHLSQ